MATSEDRALGDGLTCFVIGPIGSRLAPSGTEGRVRYENAAQMWENVFEPACEKFGMQPLRADKLAEPGEITEQIFALLRDSDVVIADLTGGNANVMYELGLRHTRHKLTIQVGEYERLPFDVNTIRTIQFRRSEAGLIDARENLIETLRAALQGRSTPVTATRIWNEVTPAGPELVADAAERSRQDDDVSGEQEAGPGWIDVLAEGEEAVQEIGSVLEEATRVFETVGALGTDVGDRVKSSDAQRGGFAGRLKIARELARELIEPSANLERLASESTRHIIKSDSAVQYILQELREDPSQLAESAEFLSGITAMAAAAEESAVEVTKMMHGARGLRKIARDLAPTSKSIERSLGQFLAAFDTLRAWGLQVEDLLGASENHSERLGNDDPTRRTPARS